MLDALNQARVETLLIAENFRASGRVDFEAGLLLPAGVRAGRAGRRHRRARDREGDRAVRDARWSCATTTTSSRWAASERCCDSEESRSSAPGIMGAPMARNLAGAGHEVRAWNRTASKAEGLGATVAGSPAEAVDGADVVITMLSDGPTVGRGDGGRHADRRPGLVAGEHRRRRLDRAARATGFVDGPVMGTRQPAEQGALTVLASGPGRERLGDVFEPVAAKVVDLGDEIGAGTRMKLVGNAWVLALVEGLAETIALAEGLGVDPRAVPDDDRGRARCSRPTRRSRARR